MYASVCVRVRACALCKTKRNERYDDIISSRIIFQVNCFSYDCFYALALTHQTTPDFRCIRTHTTQFPALFCFILPRAVHRLSSDFGACEQKKNRNPTQHITRTNESKTKTHQTNNFVANHGNSKWGKKSVIIQTSNRMRAVCLLWMKIETFWNGDTHGERERHFVNL